MFLRNIRWFKSKKAVLSISSSLLEIVIPLGCSLHSIQQTYTMLVEYVDDYISVNQYNLKIDVIANIFRGIYTWVIL